MNTRTLVKPIIICLLFAEIIMVGVTLLRIVYTIRIYLQDKQNPLSGFGRILFGPRSFWLPYLGPIIFVTLSILNSAAPSFGLHRLETFDL